MFQKHTGTAILLNEPITAHEGAMSFVHYRTLRANPLYRVFYRVSCDRHVWYNRSLFWWVLGRKEDPAAVSILLYTSDVWQPRGGDALLQSKPEQIHVLLWSDDAELVHQAALQFKPTKKVASQVERVCTKTRFQTDESKMQRRRIHTTWKWAFAYIWLLNAVLIPLRYSLWDLTVTKAKEGKLER